MNSQKDVNNKDDLYEIETKDTKDGKNHSYNSENELIKRKNPFEQEKLKRKNNERILDHIKAKKLQKNLLKSEILIQMDEKNTKNSNNFCAKCSIF